MNDFHQMMMMMILLVMLVVAILVDFHQFLLWLKMDASFHLSLSSEVVKTIINIESMTHTILPIIALSCKCVPRQLPSLEYPSTILHLCVCSKILGTFPLQPNDYL